MTERWRKRWFSLMKRTGCCERPGGCLAGPLGIDENSEIYLVETWVASFGRMPDAMVHLLLGVRPVTVHDGSD